VKPATLSFYATQVQVALRSIAAQLDQALDVAELARAAGLSPLHFHRIFRGMIGETALDVHRRMRLERAAAQLVNADTAITTIAFNAGYETHESFTRAFRNAFAASPTEFRARAASAAQACAPRPQVYLAAQVGLHFDSAADTAPQLSRLPGAPLMQVELIVQPSQRVAAVAHRGPYNTISDAFARLGAIAGPSGLFGYANAAMIALYYDDPETTPPAELRSDAGIVVPSEITLPPGLHEVTIAAGKFARATHVGPYTLLGDTWARFMGQWLPQSGQRIGAGVSFELYRNNPMTVKPADLITELYLPLQ